MQEEVQVRLGRIRDLGVGQTHGGGADVVRVEGARRTLGLQALVVACRALAVVDDGGDDSGGVLQGDHGGVEVAGFPDLLVEVLAEGVHLDDVAQEEAGHVEVVDGHVAEDAAGDLHVLSRGSGGVARDDEQVLQVADCALFELSVNCGEGGVEAAVEAEHDGHGNGVQFVASGLDVLHVQRDRLLAQHGLAGLGGGEQVRDVQRRGRADDDGVDAFVGEDGVHVGRVAGAVDLGQLLRGVTERIGNEGEGGAGVGGDGLGVDVADAAGADNGNVEHLCFFLGERVC